MKTGNGGKSNADLDKVTALVDRLTIAIHEAGK